MHACTQNNRIAAHECYYYTLRFTVNRKSFSLKYVFLFCQDEIKIITVFFPPSYILYASTSGIFRSVGGYRPQKKKQNQKKLQILCVLLDLSWETYIRINAPANVGAGQTESGKTISFDAQDLLVCISVRRWMTLRPRICRRLWRYFYLSIRHSDSPRRTHAHGTDILFAQFYRLRLAHWKSPNGK